jgi:hypothetical protein
VSIYNVVNVRTKAMSDRPARINLARQKNFNDQKGITTMAHKIQAINAYRPRIEQGNTVQKAELVRELSHATSLVEGVVSLTMSELKFRLIGFLRAGRAVKVEGLGTWMPTISLDGTISIQYRPDLAFDYELNQPGAFTAPIFNKDNIGKTSEDLVGLWNTAHPDDPVLLN